MKKNFLILVRFEGDETINPITVSDEVLAHLLETILNQEVQVARAVCLVVEAPRESGDNADSLWDRFSKLPPN